jgi:hypothetical protein
MPKALAPGFRQLTELPNRGCPCARTKAATAITVAPDNATSTSARHCLCRGRFCHRDPFGGRDQLDSRAYGISLMIVKDAADDRPGVGCPESSSLSSWRTRLTSALPTLHGTSMFIDCGHPSRSDPNAGTGHAPTVVTRPGSIRVSRRCPIGHQVDI